MLQFSKLISLFAFAIFIYSIYKMSLREEVVFYIGMFIVSISVLMLSVGILGMSKINKKSSKNKES